MNNKIKTVAIIDYKISNLFSVKNALDNIGFKGFISSDPDLIIKADNVILPGVGSFPSAMEQINKLGLKPIIKKVAMSKKPFLGICLGFQLLFEFSEEFGECEGLGLIKGKVKHLSKVGKIKNIPHVGWNKIIRNQNIDNKYNLNIDNEYFYFIHSYVAQPEIESDIYSKSNIDGIEFCSSIYRDNILATQFHPEKSGKVGLEMIKKFFNGD